MSISPWLSEITVRSTTESPHEIQADAVVVGVHSDAGMTDAARQIDEASGNSLRKLIELGEIKGKSKEITLLMALPGVASPRVIVAGLGNQDAWGNQNAFEAAGAAAMKLSCRQHQRVAYYLDSEDQAVIEHAVAGSIVGCVGQDLYRHEKTRFPFGEIVWSTSHQAALARGNSLGQGINLTRRLVNEPADEIYPESFADVCRKLAGTHQLEIEVWDQARLEQEQCRSLLAVAKGASREPRLVVLKYQGNPQDAQTFGLVGKGVTFDSGGLSLKVGDHMMDMKCDMAGAATVVGALHTIASQKVPVNVVGLVGLVENMTGPAAYKLGDVLTARNGKTIEVLNTDAEGRLVLADVLCVAQDQGITHMVDLATLTGACVVALGLDVAGLMTNNQAWCDCVARAASDAGELVWQLPMFPEYDELIRSEVADIKNIGGRWGGAITAAKLLAAFVGDVPWTHIDIAGPAFLNKPKSYVDAGGSGALVRTLVQLVRPQ